MFKTLVTGFLFAALAVVATQDAHAGHDKNGRVHSTGSIQITAEPGDTDINRVGDPTRDRVGACVNSKIGSPDDDWVAPSNDH